MISEADVAIIVCGDKDVQPYHDFLIEDCSASIENILLSIHGYGLGAVWCGVPEIMSDCVQIYVDKLHLPENILPVGTIAVGGVGEEKTYIDRYNEGKVHENCW